MDVLCLGEEFVYERIADEKADFQLPSTQLCVVYRWLHAAKHYFIGLQKNWESISFT